MRLLATLSVLGLLAMTSGCAMCCAPFDNNYPCLAGRWNRTNPTTGRVGSAFEQVGMPTESPSPNADEPTPAPANPGDPDSRAAIPRNLDESYLQTIP
jgi:hypothetical protein